MNIVDLSGYWQFENNTGLNFPSTADFDKTIKLPGTMDKARLGNPVTEKTAWHLNRIVEYTGPAFYKRTVYIPKGFEEKHIELFLERCHWESTVYVDDSLVGSNESLSVPHRYDLTGFLTPGKHTLILKIDNTVKYDIGELAHGITDHTQTNWNGVIGKIELRVSEKVTIDSAEAVPFVDAGGVEVKVSLKNYLKRQTDAVLKIAVLDNKTGKSVSSSRKGISLKEKVTAEEMFLGINTINLWDEFNPNLYTIKIEVEAEDENKIYFDDKNITFGMRKLASSSDGFTMNGRPVFLRGTLDCCVFPLSGCPSMSLGDWLTRLEAAKSYGFNHIRFHSWCPPEAAFEAGDKLGLIFQIEAPDWTVVGEKPEVDKFITEETLRIIDEYSSHPSFCMMAAGNEPSGENKESFLKEIEKKWREKGSTILFTGCSGWPELDTSDYHVLKNRPGALRCQDWAEELDGRLNKKPFDTDYDYSKLIEGSKAPVVSHEVGQWCAFPDFKEIKKYTGVLAPKNFEIFKDLLKEKGLLDLSDKFLKASGRFQVAEYKEDIECALRTPHFGGFQLLGLTDFSGQGTAIVGVQNAFCESKGYTDEKEFSSFNCETVPLARMKRVVFKENETFSADITVANYGEKELKNAVIDWSLNKENGEIVSAGCFEPQTIPFGSGKIFGKVSLLLKAEKSEALNFILKIRSTKYQNSWKIWVYKNVSIDKSGVKIVRTLEQAKTELEGGNRVLYMPKKEDFKNTMPSGFTTVFWNYEFTAHQAPRSLGILCDPKNLCLKDFPTEDHSEWQWFDLVTNSKFMVLDKCKTKIDPIIRVIDDWNTSDSFGLLFEAKVKEGKLMMCSIDLENEIMSRPVASQLLSSVLNYMRSDKFEPKTELTEDDIEGILLAKEDKKTKLFDYREIVHVDEL